MLFIDDIILVDETRMKSYHSACSCW